MGQIRLFFTACTHERAPTFADPAVVAVVESQLLNTCQRADVEVTAYCFMRDHVHALIAGKTDCAEIGAAIGRWKQVSGYWYRKQRSGRLWQVNYWDRVLRQRDHSGEVVRYILSDPIREGLVEQLEDYAHFGSSRWSRAELIGMVKQTPM